MRIDMMSKALEQQRYGEGPVNLHNSIAKVSIT